ncbi:MAG: tRNA (N(6)-L-threonylcarbamoyladenosine(37)-C(2))-methylthiotransferase MtaB [Bacillota bacterium]|nr:tRNA (N(6)-L-threonylcarbamoyladenosine(37)-C(2))-methylthiotransferase MtaB [Bacillota bacterium]
MKIAFHTLGCKVNQYESEAMAQMFRSRGHEIVSEKDFADVYVINTCTVTAVADKKSRQYIRRMKKVNPDSLVAVTGCYAQISPEEVSGIDGVDIVTGTNEKHTLIDYVEKRFEESSASSGGDTQPQMLEMHMHAYDELGAFEDMGIVSSRETRTRAYIKIQEGCNRFCSYCVIPYARGPVRSRPLASIVSEAKALLAEGCKELVLTGINTAQYDMEGRNLYGASGSGGGDIFGVEKVIAAINGLEGDFRIRLSSLEPAVVNAEYVKRLFQYDKLCHHLHMSAQSGSDRILKAMNRPYDLDQYYEMVNTLFAFDECYGVSTDIIVGFPGEKESDFEDSMKLVRECGFVKTHIFKYSKRPLTKAAEMKDQVSPQVKNRRSDMLEKAAAKAAEGFFETNLGASAEGRTERVLLEEIVEKPSGRYLTGFTGNYIRVYIEAGQGAELLLDTFADVRLTGIVYDGMSADMV